MEKHPSLLRCFIGAAVNREIDENLDRRGFAHGMAMFAIPELGVLSRARVHGSRIDLEVSALFALFEFLQARLDDDSIQRVEVLSSLPRFVFSFSNATDPIWRGPRRSRLLTEYRRRYHLSVGYIKEAENAALRSSQNLASLPPAASAPLKPTSGERDPLGMKPFRRGLHR